MTTAELTNGTSREEEKGHEFENGGSFGDAKTLDAGGYANGTVNGYRKEPPDGGLRAWSIMVASFLINGLLFGVINTFSLIYIELQKILKLNGITDVSSKAALAGSLTIGTTFFLSPIAGILTDKIGIQLTTLIGGALAALGMYFSSLLVNQVEYLWLTYGVMYGLGASLAYTPSLVILGHYFKRHLGFVNGVVTTGSSVFTILLPFAITRMLEEYGLEATFRNLAALTAVLMLCAILFKPIPQHSSEESEAMIGKKKFRTMLKETVNRSIWKRKKYVVWASAIPIALLGYYVFYVHIGQYITEKFSIVTGNDSRPHLDSPDLINNDENDKKNSTSYPLMCIGIGSGIGRLVFGYVADLPRVNRILLQQISFVMLGILTMAISFIDSYTLLLVVLLVMGLFDGCFISLLGPIAFDICGQKDAAQAIGFLLGLCSVPLTVGPPIAGLIHDHTKSYDLSFLLAGVPPIIGALVMCLVYLVKDEPIERGDDEELGPNVESPADPKSRNGIAGATLYLSGERIRQLSSVSSLDRSDDYRYYCARGVATMPPQEYSPLIKKLGR